MKKILKKVAKIESLDELTAPELADFIQLLIASEVKPGGPYKFNGVENLNLLNNRIYRLFAVKGKKLNPEMLTRPLKPPTIAAESKDRTHTALYKSVLKDFAHPHGVKAVLDKIKKTDKHGEISYITPIFLKSLKKKYASKISPSEKTLDNYSLANIYTWLAYSLIDNILDKDTDASMLPLISIAQRKIMNKYISAGVDIGLIEALFEEVDNANAKEQTLRKKIKIDIDRNKVVIHTNNFIGTKKLLAEKSIAHTLGPIHISSLVSSQHQATVKKAMLLYCSSRQLNDDLHDWMDDFANGQPTFVISCLLENLSVKKGSHDYTDLLERMKNTYWESVLELCCTKIQIDIQEAINLLESTILKTNSEFTSSFLRPIADSANEALHKHEFEKSFLKNFKSS
jgi:hypothetical protein